MSRIIRMLTAVTAAGGIALAGLVTTGAAALASTGAASAGTGLHHVRVINLQHARRAALARGVTLNPREFARPRAAGTSGCVEPDCNLTYGGGLIQNQPKVYLLFWGPDWSTAPEQVDAANHLEQFYSGLGRTGDKWSALTTQYGDSSGAHPSFDDTGVLLDTFQDTSTPPQGTTSADFLAEAEAFYGGDPGNRYTNDQLVIATQSTIMPDGYPGWCGYHSFAAGPTTSSGYGAPYVVLPYIRDLGEGVCANYTVAGPTDGYTIVASHEFAETITDPIPNTGWKDRHKGGGEIADKCWPQRAGVLNANLTLTTGTFPVQPLWSNTEHDCTMQLFLWAHNPVNGLAVSQRYTQADISWKASKNARDYRVVVKRVSTGATIQNTIVTGISTTIHNLSENVKYTVNVKARPALPDTATSTVSFTTL